MSLIDAVQNINRSLVLEKAKDKAVEEIVQGIRDKGIRQSGDLENSVRGEIVGVEPLFEALIYMKKYGIYHSKGVAPENIPFSPGGGRRGGGGGGTSKYIQGLYAHFRFLGKSEKEAMSAAFGTATLQSRYGAPLSYYRRFGRGSNFLAEAVERIEKSIGEIIVKDFTDPVRQAIKVYIEREFNSIPDIAIEL